MSEKPPTQGPDDDLDKMQEPLLPTIDDPADLHGLDGARRLADEAYERAREALAAAGRAGTDSPGELEQITDFIKTRSY